jgi:hypothetical protein
MPFKKVPGKSTYKSPSGRTFTAKQVKAYYASNQFTKPVRKPARKGKK